MIQRGLNIEHSTPWVYVQKALDLGCRHFRWQIYANTDSQKKYEETTDFLVEALRIRLLELEARGANVCLALMRPPPDLATLPHVWQEVARCLESSGGIWGFDILNEPAMPVMRWIDLATQSIRYIKDVNRFRCVVQSRKGEPGKIREVSAIRGADVLSVHFYRQMSYTHQGLYSYPAPKGASLSPVKESLNALAESMEGIGKPLYVGEFSVVNGAPNAQNWLRLVINECARHRWHSAYHSWMEGHPWSAECEDRRELIQRYFSG